MTVVGRIASGHRDLALGQPPLIGELRGLGGAGERDLGGEIAARVPEDAPAQLQGGAVRIEREGAIHRHQRLRVLPRLPRGIPRLVPRERQVGVKRDRLLDPVEPLGPVAEFDVGGADEGEGESFSRELGGGVFGRREGIIGMPAGAEQLEQLAPGGAVVGVVAERGAVGELGVLRASLVRQGTRTRQAPGPGLGCKESILCA